MNAFDVYLSNLNNLNLEARPLSFDEALPLCLTSVMSAPALVQPPLIHEARK